MLRINVYLKTSAPIGARKCHRRRTERPTNRPTNRQTWGSIRNPYPISWTQHSLFCCRSNDVATNAISPARNIMTTTNNNISDNEASCSSNNSWAVMRLGVVVVVLVVEVVGLGLGSCPFSCHCSADSLHVQCINASLEVIKGVFPSIHTIQIANTHRKNTITLFPYPYIFFFLPDSDYNVTTLWTLSLRVVGFPSLLLFLYLFYHGLLAFQIEHIENSILAKLEEYPHMHTIREHPDK